MFVSFNKSSDTVLILHMTTIVDILRDLIFLICLDAELISRSLQTPVYIYINNTDSYRYYEQKIFRGTEYFRRYDSYTKTFTYHVIPLVFRRNQLPFDDFKPFVNTSRFTVDTTPLGLCLMDGTQRP